MNLRKATKAQLIKEVRRLRQVEIHKNDLLYEIKRRDAATAKYNQLMPEILGWATALAVNKIEEANGTDDWWEFYWMMQPVKNGDSFWYERMADKVDEYAPIIKDSLLEAEEIGLLTFRKKDGVTINDIRKTKAGLRAKSNEKGSWK